MPQMSSKVAQAETAHFQQSSAAGSNSAALSPPAYGIDFVDRPVERENKTGLPDQLKAGIENLSGLAMDDVRVHYNSSKPAQLQALAYTQGTEIYVGPGQERHLPHEAWHVVQQKEGRVQATLQAKGTVINDDASLEREADVMSAKALGGKAMPRMFGASLADTLPNTAVVQRAYNATTGKYEGRPPAPSTFYPAIGAPMGTATQKAHKYPMSWISDPINDALALSQNNSVPNNVDEAMALLEKVAAFSGKPFSFPPGFKGELALAPGGRSPNFKTIIDRLAIQAGWTEWNMRRTPLPEERDPTYGGDDPGSSDFDLNYTSSGHTTPRSFEVEHAHMEGGIKALDPVELSTRLSKLVDKQGQPVNKDQVLPYDVTAWENVGTRTIPQKVKRGIVRPARTIPIYRNKNNPENWQGPFAEISYPRQGEAITADNYSIRVECNSKTNNVEVKIQKVGTQGNWVNARPGANSKTWWLDWYNIEHGDYEIIARAWSSDGKDFVSRHIMVTAR